MLPLVDDMSDQVEIVAMASVTSFDPLRVWLYNEAVVYLRAPVHIPASGVDYGFASADQKPRVWGLDDDTDVDPVPDASGRVHRSWTWLQGYTLSSSSQRFAY